MTPVVLYVDDEEVNLFLFESLFKDFFKVITAISGPIALEKLETHKEIQVVITDMNMPKMDGLQLVEAAREKYNHLHHIILTGYPLNAEMKAAVDEKRVYSCLHKPFEKKIVLEQVKQLVPDVSTF